MIANAIRSTYVLIPGAGGSAWYWHRLVDELRRRDRFFPLEFQRRLAQERLGITVDEMPGGHLVTMSQPRELADRLETYQAQRP